MNVKYKIIILILLFSLVLVGCLKESYSMQYGFSGELITETKLESKPDGVYLEMPFADFSCDSKSFKASLDVSGKNLVLSLSGNETKERCSVKFYADIMGIKPGDYWLKVIYNKNGESQEVLYQEFNINK